MLDDNPNDNQGVRFLVLEILAAQADWNGLSKALEIDVFQGDASALVSYARVLADLPEVDVTALGMYANLTPEREDLTLAALAANPCVPAVLVDLEAIAFTNPNGGYSLGHFDEAHMVAHMLRPGFRNLPGADRWLLHTSLFVMKKAIGLQRPGGDHHRPIDAEASAENILFDLAHTTDWRRLGLGLNAAGRAPWTLGCADKNHVMREVAKARGLIPASLRKSMDAVDFLARVKPELLAEGPHLPALPKVLLVRAMHNIDANTALAILTDDHRLTRTEKGLKRDAAALRGAHPAEPGGVTEAQRTAQDAVQRARCVGICVAGAWDGPS